MILFPEDPDGTLKLMSPEEIDPGSVVM
jgi:hypothetical protein